ncbi:hypothetical protein [Jiangella mangrovi]|uniref:Right-handed parallel beta-helix repeat-containing protein n=1 Tax=Jiangella mangrovi TaxID=1524084 RepID=A0A7W9GUP9_9ACTN|nr:hypothetical protein [Jiangella mangrovi]MBB5790051.1 hypothetical protein [Jiangella mangrovi]
MSTFTRRALVTAATAGAAAGVVATAPAAGAARPSPRRLFSAGEFESTMDPAATGAANAAAFLADVTAADGRQVVVPPGTYTVAQVIMTDLVVNVRFMPGALLLPDASLHAVGPAGRWFHATNCDTRLYGLNADGQNLPEDCWRSDGGEFRAYDTTMINMGFTDLVGNSTSLGTLGILCKTVKEVIIDGYVGRDFVGRKDDVYANQAGKVNHLMMYECERVAIRNVTISGGEGEDNDFFHLLDLRPVPTMHGTIESCHLYYNGQTRRCMKFQGGNWDVRDVHCYPGADFVSVNPAETDIGEQNLNCIDWAGSVEGTLRLSGSYIDATGYSVGVSHTWGPLGRVIVENCTIVGGRRLAKRNNPEPPHAYSETQTMGFFAIPQDNDSEIRDSLIKGFSRSVVVQGNRNRVVGNTIDDPQIFWLQAGSSTAKDFLEVSDNKVMTRTPGAMATRCSRIDNYTNVEVRDNTLIRVPGTVVNDTHGVFIDITNAGATGFATNNRAPAGTTSVRAGASNVAVYQNQGQLLRPLLTTGPVGNGGTGEDNLQIQAVPAYNLHRIGNAVRSTFTGTTANNANAKTLRVYVGTTVVLTAPLTPGQAGSWEVQLVVIAVPVVGGELKYTVKLLECDTAGAGAPTVALVATGATTQVTTQPIILKTTAEAVANGDVISQVAVTEALDGRHFIFT